MARITDMHYAIVIINMVWCIVAQETNIYINRCMKAKLI